MRSKALLVVCLCVVLAGCGTTVPGTPTTSTGETTTTIQTTTNTERTTATTYRTVKRFDGDANTYVSVRNPTNETWNTTFRIERNGTVVLNETRSIQSGGLWQITTLNQPGNYTFTIHTGVWQDTLTTRLPRAYGDNLSWVEVDKSNGEFYLSIRWQQ